MTCSPATLGLPSLLILEEGDVLRVGPKGGESRERNLYDDGKAATTREGVVPR